MQNTQQEQQKGTTNDALYFDSYNFTDNIPKEPLKWLKKYGITDQEIKDYSILWDTKRSFLIFVIGSELLVGRNFTNSGQKYVTQGEKRFLCFRKDKELPSDTLIFCEDMVSAIKIARHYTSCPVLGADVPISYLVGASRRFQNVGIWLDPDMAGKVARIAQKARFLGSANIFRVVSEKDPKDYSDESIMELVEHGKR